MATPTTTKQSGLVQSIRIKLRAMRKLAPSLEPVRIKAQGWFNARIERSGNSVILTGRSIYVIPTRYGFMLATLLFGLLLGAMNYSNSMTFMMTFLVAGIAMLGMHFTYGTLVKLNIEPAPNKAVFAGQSARVKLLATPLNGRQRYGLILGNSDEHQLPTHITEQRGAIYYQTPTLKRGRYTLPRTRIWTTFPFGLFYSWAWIKLDSYVLVYPQPQSFRDHLSSSGSHHGEQPSERKGDDDFAGIRRHQTTDSPNRIAWKALAHSQQLLSKEFNGTTDNNIWLNYDDLAELNPEQRLSQLCQWILDCERDHRPYGLNLPGLSIEIDLGEKHQNNCLKQLALFET